MSRTHRHLPFPTLPESRRRYARGFAGKNDVLTPDNTIPKNESAEIAKT
jgi:hypothetical protein